MSANGWHRRLVGDLHVTASARDVIRHVRARIEPHHQRAREAREARHSLFRDCLEAHQEHRELYARVMGGGES